VRKLGEEIWRRGGGYSSIRLYLADHIIVLDGKEIEAPEGDFVLRLFASRVPRYINVGNDAAKALSELQKHARTLKAQHTLERKATR
jgi:hypothetical protein